jgi:PST family polysaccharide transporter
VKRFDWLNYKVLFFNFNIHIVKKLSNFSLMAVVSVLTVSLIQLQIRNYIIDYFTMQEAGYWQGVVRICDLYISFITTTLGVYFLPKLSELKSSKELNSEIKRGYLFILPVVIIASLFLYILRMKVILILYAPEFSPMERLFTFQIIGTVLKMASWLLAFLMLAKAMTKIYILTEIIFGLNYYFLTVIFINKYSLIGATYAYSLNYFLYLVTMIIIFRRILFYKMYLLKL